MRTGKKGKITAVVMAVVMILSSVPLSGFTGLDFSSWVKTEAGASERVKHNNDFYDGVIDGLYYNILNNEVTITACDENKTGEVVIPETIEGYPVTAIGGHAFLSCEAITQISIPDTVKAIGQCAFERCTALTGINIPEGVTSIPMFMFYCCDNLMSIDIPNSVTDIGHNAFYMCGKLTEIFIPENVKSISSEAFLYCKSITGFSVSDKNEYFSTDENGVLYNKDKTELVRFPSGKECSVFEIPETVISITDYAFSMCENLAGITIPSGVTRIGKYAFWQCGFTSLQILCDEVTVGESAFIGCSSLTSIELGSGVKSIDVNAFDFCDSLEYFSVSEENAYYSNDEYGVLFNRDKTELIRYPINGSFKYKIPNSVKNIQNDAFSSCYRLTDLEISNGVISIGNNTFYYCHCLTGIEIPASVTNIGSHAFASCTAITGFSVSEENKYYSSDEYGVLYNKDKTELIAYPLRNERMFFSVPNTVLKISDAFEYCRYLNSVEISDSVTHIEAQAFAGCSELESILIPDNVESIGAYAFNHSDKLTIYGYAGSYAETYAEENNIPFKTTCKSHSFQSYNTATCLSGGYTCDKCSVCGFRINIKEASPLGHLFINYVSDNNATCTSDGTKTAKCERCTATDTVTEISAPGHSFKGEVRANFDGTHSFKCERCDTYGDTVLCGGGTATCTQRAVCSACNTEYGFALGHIFINYISDGNATCTSDGTKTAKCERCTVTDIVTDENSKKPHEDSDGDGFCDFCKASMKQEETGFIDRIREMIKDMIDSILDIIRRLFG